MDRPLRSKTRKVTKIGRTKTAVKLKKPVDSSKITTEYVQKLAAALKENPVKLRALKKVQVALTILVKQHSSGKAHKVDIKGFNKLIHLCLQHFVQRLCKLLRIKFPLSDRRRELPSSSRKWERTERIARKYLLTVMKLFEGISEPIVAGHLLRYFRTVYKLYLCFPRLCMHLIKLLVSVWSESESEENRIAAFFCLHRLSHADKKWHVVIIKRMFKSYQANSKCTSAKDLTRTNLLATCFVEICRLDSNLAYKCCFVYMRQLGIHLRTAIRSPKKEEACQVICSWQYIQSLGLLCRVTSEIDDEAIQLLLYPVVHIVVATVRLLPAPRYYPLRFHCIRMLTRVCHSCAVYIPVLPMILEVVRAFDFNKKPKTLMVRKVNFSRALSCRGEYVTDKSFYVELATQIHDATLSYLSAYAHHISFPELIFPLKMSLRRVIKNCTNGQLRKTFKNLFDRVIENAKEIEARRSRVSLDLRDREQTDQWNRQSAADPPPLTVYFEKYSELNEKSKQAKTVSFADSADEDNLEVVNGEAVDESQKMGAETEFAPPVKKPRRKREIAAKVFTSDTEDELQSVGMSDLDLNESSDDLIDE